MSKNLRLALAVAVLAGCLGALTAGCGKQGVSNSTDAPANAELTELTKQVRRYSFEKRRVPLSLDELVTAGYIKSVPAAPAGKKFAIDADRVEVTLVNQ